MLLEKQNGANYNKNPRISKSQYVLISNVEINLQGKSPDVSTFINSVDVHFCTPNGSGVGKYMQKSSLSAFLLSILLYRIPVLKALMIEIPRPEI